MWFQLGIATAQIILTVMVLLYRRQNTFLVVWSVGFSLYDLYLVYKVFGG